MLPLGQIVHAQEVTDPSTTDQTTQTSDTTQTNSDPTSTPEPETASPVDPTPSQEPSPTVTPVIEPSSSPTPVEAIPTAEPTPIPFDPYNHPPYASPEYDEWKVQYDIWKAEQQKQDDLQEQREDEWEENEENQTWIDTHGSDESYYTSGAWETDQIAAQQQAQNQNNAIAQDSQTSSISTSGNGSSYCTNTHEETIESGPLASESNISDSNTATSVNSDTVNVSNDNCADISNNSQSAGVSGTNGQNGNDGNVSMATGNAQGSGNLTNQANLNTTDSGFVQSGAEASTNDSFASGPDAENLNTDENSTNLTQASETNTLNVDNDNTILANNNMNVEATSGQNSQIQNDGSAKLTTGDLELIANMLNILNMNITGDDFMHLIVNIFGTLNGNLDLDDIALALGLADDEELEIIAKNDNPGDDSTNEAIADKEEDTNTDNNNSATVNNEMDVTGVSGQNEQIENDGQVDITTGRIKILANLMNFINSNFSGDKWSFIMINVFGGLNGDIVLPSEDPYLTDENGQVIAQNTNVGDDSTSSSTASSSETTTTTNTNNVALTNSVSADGISGQNEQVGNDGAMTIDSGQIDVATRVKNFLNFNITGNNFVFLVVNVFGKWMGQIVGFADWGTIDAPSEGTFAALSVGQDQTPQGSDTSSSGGGENSTNVADASYINNTNVNNANTATISNDMDITGISGQNTQSTNDGGGSIKTGWVEIDANLLNIINMNVSGKKWMMVFLNVFGDFMGDLYFGRENVPVTPPLPQLANIPVVNNIPEIIPPLIFQQENPANNPTQNSQDNNDNEDSSSNDNDQPNQQTLKNTANMPSSNFSETTNGLGYLEEEGDSSSELVSTFKQTRYLVNNNEQQENNQSLSIMDKISNLGEKIKQITFQAYDGLLAFFTEALGNFFAFTSSVVYGEEVNP